LVGEWGSGFCAAIGEGGICGASGSGESVCAGEAEGAYDLLGAAEVGSGEDFLYFRTFVRDAVFGRMRRLVDGVDGLSQTATKTSPTKTRHDKSSIIRIWDRPAGCDDQR
jgi:hypothetical protein